MGLSFFRRERRQESIILDFVLVGVRSLQSSLRCANFFYKYDIATKVLSGTSGNRSGWTVAFDFASNSFNWNSFHKLRISAENIERSGQKRNFNIFSIHAGTESDEYSNSNHVATDSGRVLASRSKEKWGLHGFSNNFSIISLFAVLRSSISWNSIRLLSNRATL